MHYFFLKSPLNLLFLYLILLTFFLAMNNLGVCYYEANGVEKNFKKALKFFTKSANLEDPYGNLIIK